MLAESPVDPVRFGIRRFRILVELIEFVDLPGLHPGIGAVGVVRGATDIPRVSAAPGAGVDAEFQAETVNFIGERLHVGKLLVRLDRVESAAARPLPAIVDINISPTVFAQSPGRHRARRIQYMLLADGIAPTVPTAPAHRRRQCDRIANDNTKSLHRLAQGVLRAKGQLIFAGAGQRTRYPPRFGIEREPIGQTLGSEAHGTLPRCGDGVEKRRLRPDTKYPRAIHARRRRRGRSENLRHFRSPDPRRNERRKSGEKPEEENAHEMTGGNPSRWGEHCCSVAPPKCPSRSHLRVDRTVASHRPSRVQRGHISTQRYF